MFGIKKFMNNVTLFVTVFVVFCVYCIFNDKKGLNEKSEKIESFTYDWQLEYIHAPMMWSKTKGANITVAVIDSGINYDLLGADFDRTRIVTAYNAYDCSADLTDYTSHGTSMVSIIGANGENGFYGVAPDCKFIIVKVFDSLGMTNSETLVRAINFAINNKTDIINLSLGSESINENVAAVITKAIKCNIIVTGSVGDQKKDSILFPALLDEVLSVGAIDCNGSKYIESNYSDKIDVFMPGVDIKVPKFNILKERIESKKSGSSVATALFSGALALYLDYLQEYDSYDIYAKFRRIGNVDLLNFIY